jgi:hypothetical protein
MRTLLLSTALVAGLASPALAEPTSLAFDHPIHAPRALVYTASLTPASTDATPPAPPTAHDDARDHGTTIFGLPKNMGPIDRVARAVIGSALLGVGVWGLSTSGHLSSTTSGVLIGVSAIPFATAATGYCPIYQLVGVDYTF